MYMLVQSLEPLAICVESSFICSTDLKSKSGEGRRTGLEFPLQSSAERALIFLNSVI